MKQSVLVLGNSDSGLYDFRKEVLMALMQEGYEVHVSVPDTGYLEKIKKLGCICHETVMERRGMNPLKDGKLLLFYRKLLKTIHPAAVLICQPLTQYLTDTSVYALGLSRTYISVQMSIDLLPFIS